MLKIKDNIDLKELEKYGFEPYEYGYCTEDTYVANISDYYFKERIICENSHESTETYADTLYDLIKDGLVEKV
jgi:hypothetical protein